MRSASKALLPIAVASLTLGCAEGCGRAPEAQSQTPPPQGFAASFEEATPERPWKPPEDTKSHVNRAGSAGSRPLDLTVLKAPEGFSLSVYSDKLPGARTLRRGGKGIVYVGTRDQGKVYALVDADEDGTPEKALVVAEGLEEPNGLAYRDGTLFIAEIGRISRLDGIDDKLENPPAPVLVTDALPKEKHHGWRYIDFGPDGALYVAVGAPCDTCLKEEPIFASIARLRVPQEGPATELEVFAHGVRNTLGFVWHPRTKELWFTENGRDGLGDGIPPDELNRAASAGLHFGYPSCHAGVIFDPKFGATRACASSVAPVRNLDPHVAALGLEFTIDRGWPAPHGESVLIAEHGSWNREHKLGYRITEVRLDGDKAVSYAPLVTGWLDEARDEVNGRPVDLEFLSDGSLLISDDWQGAVYRLKRD